MLHRALHTNGCNDPIIDADLKPVDDWGDWADVDRRCADVSIMKAAKQPIEMPDRLTTCRRLRSALGLLCRERIALENNDLCVTHYLNELTIV